MKSFKLVLTGIVILMCILLVIAKKINGHQKNSQDTTTCIQQGKKLQNIVADNIDEYPFCILVNIPN